MYPDFYKLTLVTHKNDMPLSDYLTFVKTCAMSGLTSVQLRDKHASFDSLLNMGQAILKIIRPLGISLIVNDNLELAQALDADGLHLGQTDGDPVRARALLGPDKWIGVSIDSLADAHAANQLPIDYLGVGAIFESRSKSNVTTVWGVDGLKTLAAIARHPIIAIGGVDTSNACEVMLAGAHGVAAIEAFHAAHDPGLATKTLRAIVDGGNRS